MDLNRYLSIASFAGKLVEQNVSIIEKYQSRIKISRFIGTNLIFILLIGLASAYIGWVLFYPIYNDILHLVAPMFVVFIFVAIEKKRKTSLISATTILSMAFVLLVVFGYLFVSLAVELVDIFSVGKIVLGLAMLSFLSLFIYSAFHSSKNMSEQLLKTFLVEKYRVKITLSSGSIVEGELVTITKKGDYVVRKSSSDSLEILIRESAISSIELID